MVNKKVRPPPMVLYAPMPALDEYLGSISVRCPIITGMLELITNPRAREKIIRKASPRTKGNRRQKKADREKTIPDILFRPNRSDKPPTQGLAGMVATEARPT